MFVAQRMDNSHFLFRIGHSCVCFTIALAVGIAFVVGIASSLQYASRRFIIKKPRSEAERCPATVALAVELAFVVGIAFVAGMAFVVGITFVVGIPFVVGITFEHQSSFKVV